MSSFEFWAGFECTVARIGDVYRDQCAETGHAERLSDLDFAASLGVSRLRYPIIWETIAPDDPKSRCWSRADRALTRLRDLDLPVIAGLVHHGSGPRYTHLLDEAFPHLLAEHALAAAGRYPWIEDFTPINEPLTTARFSGLYGHWYPHHLSEASFLRALVVQCRATQEAMTAIRRVTPRARLIQTEDVGRTFSAEGLGYQAAYENERRWLSLDLLTGRVDRHHPWYARFLASGIAARTLDALADAGSPPDIVGINHYLTSDRYLDDDLASYPERDHGGNGQHRYADVAAVRGPVAASELGFEARVREAWGRYGLPVAMTEVHNGATRDEQLRWLLEAWHAAQRLRETGVDLRAFTVWAIAGGVDWPSLLTRREGLYEAGLLDARADPPRPTALAAAVRQLAATGSYAHGLLHDPGWWRRPERFHRAPAQPLPAVMRRSAPIVISGASGTLARAFARICDERGLAALSLTRGEMDIADRDAVVRVVRRVKPWAIVNAAGFVRVGEAASHASQCLRDNCEGPAVLAAVAAAEGLPLVTFSSDLVFDGAREQPYLERDVPCPTCTYGDSKARAELHVQRVHPGALIIRTSTFFGAADTFNFAHHVVTSLAQGRAFEAERTIVASPTYVPDLVHAVLDLLIDEASGIWHVTNRDSLSRSAFALAIARAAHLDASLVRVVEGTPRNTSLSSERGISLPSLDDALRRYAAALQA